MLELLSPAGSREAVTAAVQSGAGAVYLGFGDYNARRGAQNFTRESLAEAVAYCHVRGVKVYLTLNTLLSDGELPGAVEEARFASEVGADAVLVQDLGVLEAVRRAVPDLPLHASTQMSLHTLGGACRAAELGLERVVLARELSRRDIAAITQDCPAEIEVFVHGALCMCYSGQCGMSAVIGGRSGNRGACAQPCRLPYGVNEKASGGHPLSLKDANLSAYLQELDDMGVACLKLEGRMKRPEYVAVITGIYRRLLDEKRAPTQEESRQLEAAFSRSGFTDGYYRGRTGPEMFGTRPENAPEPKELFARAKAAYEKEDRRRIPVTMSCILGAGVPAQLTASAKGHTVRAEGPVPEAARNRALTAEDLRIRLEKTGGNELMEAVNLGTRGLEEALDLLEYANIPGGTKLSEERRANGADQPFGIKMWCLGNEMDGPWQTGHKSAEDYGTLAASVAAGMRAIDPNVELVVCGSSSHVMDTFGKWEETVLEKTFDNVNFVSCHAYYHPELQPDGTRDMKSFLASGVDMDGFINDVAAAIDATKARLKSKHDVFISFDEWNVWYLNEEPSKNPEGIGNWPVAPRLLEDVYSAADAVVFGDLMITLLKNADRVHAASLAQLVNVIAPIMTEPGGPAWRQTTFYPFSLTAKLAKGGTVLEPKLASGTYETDKYGEVPTINSVAVRGEDGTISVFVVNRSMEAANDFAIKLPEGFALSAVEAQTLHEDDLLAKNTLEDQNRVVLHPNTTITSDADTGTVRVTLPPVSWTAVHVK